MTADLHDAVGETLRGMVRHPDLVLDLTGRDWTIAIGRHEAPLTDIIARMRTEWQETGCGVRAEPLPDVSMDSVGTWRIPDEGEDFRCRLLAIAREKEAAHV